VAAEGVAVMTQKKKRKVLEQEAEGVIAEQDGQPILQPKAAEPTQHLQVVDVHPKKKKVKVKSSENFGGRRTSDMKRLLVS
jgi:hypothetical protein